RVARKSFLKQARRTPCDSCLPLLWTGERQDVVPHGTICRRPFDRKPFLASFCMILQCSVCKGEPAFLINNVNNSASVQRIEAEMMNQNSDRGMDLDGRIRPKYFDPTQLEHLPTLKQFASCVEHSPART